MKVGVGSWLVRYVGGMDGEASVVLVDRGEGEQERLNPYAVSELG